MSEIKFCKDCKHMKTLHNELAGSADFCTREKDKLRFLSIERKYDNFCGPEAKYFEPRLSLWQRVIQWIKT